MKKMIIFLFIIIVLSIVLVKFLDYRKTVNLINNYLDEHGYQEDILSKEIKFNSKKGNFYMKIYYKDYPDREYEYYILRGSIDCTAYEHGIEIDTEDYMEDLK